MVKAHRSRRPYKSPYPKSRFPADRFKGKLIKIHFEPRAAVIRKISLKSGQGRLPRWPCIRVMGDGTFRVYPAEDHFAVGVVGKKTDNQIRQEAKLLIQRGRTYFYRRNGAVYKRPA